MQRPDRPPGVLMDSERASRPPGLTPVSLLAVLLLGSVLGALFSPNLVAAAETTALDRIASTLDRLLETARDGRKDVVECTCRCPS